MLDFARNLRQSLGDALKFADHATLAGFDTEFSSEQPQFANPFDAPEVIFATAAALANSGCLLQVGISMLDSKGESSTCSVFVCQHDAKISISALNFLAGNDFDFKQYSTQSLRVGIDYECEIAFWRKTMGEPDEEAFEGFPAGYGEIAQRLKQEEIDFGIELDIGHFLRMKRMQHSFLAHEGVEQVVSIVPALYPSRGAGKILLHVRVVDSPARRRQLLAESVGHIELDLKHIMLVFQRLAQRRVRTVGFQALTDCLLLHNAFLGKKLSSYSRFMADIFGIIPNFLDVLLVLQHPNTQVLLQQIASKVKRVQPNKSLSGYFHVLYGAGDSHAHDAGYDALMTVRVYDCLCRQQATNCFKVKNAQKFDEVRFECYANSFTTYRCFNLLQQTPAPVRHSMYPLAKFPGKKADYSVQQAVKDRACVANLLQGTQIGVVYSEVALPEARRAWVFNRDGRVRHRWLKWLVGDQVIDGKFASILTPTAARKVFEAVELRKGSAK
ncbi:CAF1 family ribonuclease [Spironucleus salmonicida]|uniref:CAF1 family ribonuclease n=1 Tax=Spironucleus salmonicida TaxID=348837 RepID=V6LQV1_9EUKA|nr:CAF1 family ribonuclease [Spironucleus salmonicida]|eukprot:EST46081.1 CAF1 family ribonuclease [Spironucleus salmonicida]